jgi:hypothetical protein
MGSLSADITQLSSGQPILAVAALVSNPYLAAIGMRLIIAADIGTFILAVNY